MHLWEKFFILFYDAPVLRCIYNLKDNMFIRIKCFSISKQNTVEDHNSQSDAHKVMLQKEPRLINLVHKCDRRRNFSDSYVVDINERQIKLVMYQFYSNKLNKGFKRPAQLLQRLNSNTNCQRKVEGRKQKLYKHFSVKTMHAWAVRVLSLAPSPRTRDLTSARRAADKTAIPCGPFDPPSSLGVLISHRVYSLRGHSRRRSLQFPINVYFNHAMSISSRVILPIFY